jgi:type I restriction enzyme, S subunit
VGHEPGFPSDWKVRTLNEVSVKIQDGTHFSPNLDGNEFRYITSRHIGAGRLRLDSVEMISGEEHRQIHRRCDVRFGDLLLTKDGANTGNAAINTFHDEISLLSSVAFIRSNPKQSTEEYILQYLLSAPGRKQIADAMAGNAITRLTLAKIKALTVPLPPVAEQHRIADVLRDADDMIVRLERLIAKKEATRQGMMQQLLTGKVRLPGFSEQWSKQKIGDFTRVHAGGTPSTAVQRYWGGDIPWMSSGEIHQKHVSGVRGHITESGLKESSARLFPEGTVLIALAGQGKTRGTAAISRIPLATNQSIAGIYPGSEHDSDYLYFNLDSRYAELRDESAGDGGRGGLNLTIIKSLEVPFPEISEQRAIARVLVDVEHELGLLSQRLTKARNVKQGMMQELLTGRTRLPVREAAA